MSSQLRVIKDIHLAVFISHLDLLFCDTHTQNFIIYFQLDDQRGSFQTSSQSQKLSLTVFARDQNCIYRDYIPPSCQKAGFAIAFIIHYYNSL